MKNIFLSLVFIVFSILLISAQNKLEPCGTPTYKSAWLKSYQKSPEAYEKRSGTVMYVPLTIHLVTTEGGFGAFPEDKLFDALCTLNDDFKDSDIQFYIKGEIRYPESSAYNNHEDILTGAEMMFAFNVENTINCYIVDDAAGNCGYNLPYAGIALNKTCVDPEDHTWSHELGHNLSLPHPFLGWEGGIIWDGSETHSFANPAPEFVTYDYTLFKDTLILDTLIIDTAFVELMDGSNCDFAADGFCDTKPDYLATRWPCNTELMSNTVQHDPDNIPFQSDASLIMSYSFDDCAHRFTPDQINAMRANLIDEKPELLSDNFVPSKVTANSVDLNYPADEEIVHFENLEFSWEAVEGADYYMVTFYNTNPVFPGVLLAGFSEFTSENYLSIDLLGNEKTFVWEVEAFSNGAFCDRPISVQNSFTTANVSSNENVSVIPNVVLIQPNITAQGDQIKIQSFLGPFLSINVLDMQGRLLSRNKTNQTEFTMDTNHLNAAAYIIQVHLNDGQSITKRILIH